MANRIVYELARSENRFHTTEVIWRWTREREKGGAPDGRMSLGFLVLSPPWTYAADCYRPFCIDIVVFVAFVVVVVGSSAIISD